MIRDNYWNKRYWQRKNWKHGELLLIWQESAADNGLWQLFLPVCGPKDLPPEQQFNPLTCSNKLHWKETAVDELLNRGSILKLPAAKKDIFCSRQHFTTFETNVFARLAQVPAGKVISYGALAGWAGYPRAARAVGRLMAKNPFPLFYP
ncbi:MAG: MGMT family protein [Pseudomonadota bacterium]|nr:MGMT family protein [Pseudomonadota bacterium]